MTTLRQRQALYAPRAGANRWIRALVIAASLLGASIAAQGQSQSQAATQPQSAGGATSNATSSAAAAGLAGWPSRPIHLVLGYAPGGGTDILARQIATKLTERWGVPVIVDNRPGAGGGDRGAGHGQGAAVDRGNRASRG